MTTYRRNDRGFSRVWRRNKDYTLSQLKHLARRHRATVLTRGERLAVMDQRSGQQLASFAQVPGSQAREIVDETLKVYAALNPV